jgi:flagellar motor switch protein FliG
MLRLVALWPDGVTTILIVLMAISTESASSNRLSGHQKAAIAMLSLGQAASAEVMKKLSEREVRAISTAIAKLHTVTPVQTEGVLEEAHATMTKQGSNFRGGLESVRVILTQAFGPDQATKVLDRVAKSLDQEAVDFASLRQIEPQQLAKFVEGEHPQTIALVLAHLDPSQAAGLLSSLPLETRTNAAIRMATLEQISPESVRTIAMVLGQKIKNLGELSRAACGGVEAVAAMLNRLDTTTCNDLISAVEKENSTLSDTIRRFMFLFEDLVSLDATSIRELLGEVDRKVLVTALKGTSPDLQKRFLDTMSQRGAEMLKDDLDSLGPIKLKEVDAAQQTIILRARELEREGRLSLQNSSADQFV